MQYLREFPEVNREVGILRKIQAINLTSQTASISVNYWIRGLRVKYCCLTLLILVLTSCVVAQTSEERGGWVISAYLGGARTASTDLIISQPAVVNNLTFEDITLRSRSFDPPLYYGFRGAYFFERKPFLGLEAEFIHLKVFSDPGQQVRVTGQHRNVAIDRQLVLGEIVQQYSISHGVNLLLFNVAARHQIKRTAAAPQGRLILSVRGGLGPTLPHTESRVEGVSQEQYEIGRLSWQVATAAEFQVWKKVYAFGEYKFTRTRQRGKISSGDAESLLQTHHGVFGLSWHF
jgi:hypothetical protein